MQNCGLDAIINDDIIGGTIMFSACIVAALTGFCGALWAVFAGIDNWFWGVGLPCSLVGFVLGVITLHQYWLVLLIVSRLVQHFIE